VSIVIALRNGGMVDIAGVVATQSGTIMAR
jgi:hypothetical protein